MFSAWLVARVFSPPCSDSHMVGAFVEWAVSCSSSPSSAVIFIYIEKCHPLLFKCTQCKHWKAPACYCVTKTALTYWGMDTGPVGLCCNVWHRSDGRASFGSWQTWDGDFVIKSLLWCFLRLEICVVWRQVSVPWAHFWVLLFFWFFLNYEGGGFILLGSKIINFTYMSFILIFNFHHSILADIFLWKPQMGFSKIKIKLEKSHDVRFILAIRKLQRCCVLNHFGWQYFQCCMKLQISDFFGRVK